MLKPSLEISHLSAVVQLKRTPAGSEHCGLRPHLVGVPLEISSVGFESPKHIDDCEKLP